MVQRGPMVPERSDSFSRQAPQGARKSVDTEEAQCK